MPLIGFAPPAAQASVGADDAVGPALVRRSKAVVTAEDGPPVRYSGVWYGDAPELVPATASASTAAATSASRSLRLAPLELEFPDRSGIVFTRA